MRSFQNVIVFLFALIACAFAAQEAESYDTTVYITSTLYRINTVTMSGSPSGSVANQTSTIQASSYATPSITSVYSTTTATANNNSNNNNNNNTNNTNTTASQLTGSATKPSTPEFTGAASSLNANALVIALAAGVGYLVL